MTLKQIASEADRAFTSAVRAYTPGLTAEEVGTVLSLGHGIARVGGLPDVQAEELVRFAQGVPGLVFDLEPENLGIILLGEDMPIEAGQRVRRTGRVLDMPVGDSMLGRVIDPLGRPLDRGGRLGADERRTVEIAAPAIMDRAPVSTPLQTGIKAVDALIPIGKGQRELILGDRQTGKTALALDAILNQQDKDVLCIYCAIGQRDSAVARVVHDLRERDALQYTTIVVASCEDMPGLQFIAPYAATTFAEHFMAQGRDVLLVYDDLTKHARVYRELCLLLRRPPGREAYPGDIFYIHSRMLERATHLKEDKGGGSLTALPVIETQSQNLSAYIPTNLISITDGQIYLSPDLFQKGQLPAVDVGKSVSRVGGKAQRPAYRAVTGDLRLAYSQFEELERFSRFGTRLDEETRKTLQHGQRVREILKQPQYQPMPVAEQIGVLMAVAEGVFDDVPLDKVADIEATLRKQLREECTDVCKRIAEGEKISDEDRQTILDRAQALVGEKERDEDGDDAGKPPAPNDEAEPQDGKAGTDQEADRQH